MKIQVVKVLYDHKRDWWIVLKLINGEDFNIHTIPAEAFSSWATMLDTEDAQLVLDACLFAPLLPVISEDIINSVKQACEPAYKLHTAELRGLAEEKGLDPDLWPEEDDDPLAPLLQAALEGISYGKIHEGNRGAAGGTGGDDPGSPVGPVGRQGDDLGVADGDRPVPASGVRRIVAGEQAVDG